MRTFSESYKFQITPITPIHIGSGEDINPGEYFIFDTEEMIYIIDMGHLAAKLNKPESRKTILGWIESDPIGWVAKAKNNKDLESHIRKYSQFSCEVTEQVAEKIRERWGEGKSQLTIQMMPRVGKTVYIPGSSIKGALRTALLWHFAEKPLPNNIINDGISNNTSWERIVLGGSSRDIQNDPLRHIKISDAIAKDVQTVVFDTKHVGMKTNRGEQAELQDYRECLPDTICENPSYTINAILTIESGHQHFQDENLSTRLTKDIILQSCREFYTRVFESDRQYWRRNGNVDQDIISEMEARIIDTTSQDTAPIRLGWGCGMDTISLNLAKRPGSHPPRGINYRF
ncbi:TPA: type III-A CRISPR-associated RAMP protein Csm5, partial [bacterium]|nr:type III-A CRISPR-associated RAMP protein Csm5 [bacterium]